MTESSPLAVDGAAAAADASEAGMVVTSGWLRLSVGFDFGWWELVVARSQRSKGPIVKGRFGDLETSKKKKSFL